jgi:hypothetical protein
MPRKDESARYRRTEPADVEDRAGTENMEDTEHTDPVRRTETPPEAWLENPRNIQAFFEAVERARKAKNRKA